MNTKTHVEVEFIRTGQTRSYGPNETEAILSVGFTNYFGDYVPVKDSEEWVRRIAKAMIGWVEEGEGDWFSTRLITFENIEPGKWRVITRAAYTD